MGDIISGIGTLLGGGPNNSKFQAQQAAIGQGTNTNQIGTAYDQSQTGIGQQQQLAGQLGAQGALGQNSQAALTQALTNQMNGVGPNPAQSMLNQNTGNNIAAQAALMAGQRGAGANAGLLARQVGQQGAGIQQNAVGQGATLGAQQQLAAQQQLQGLAGTQIGQQQNALTGYNQAAQGEQGALQQALANQNNAAIASQSNANNTNAAVAEGNAKQSGGFLSGALNGIGGVLGGGLFGSGGVVGGPGSLSNQISTTQIPSYQFGNASLPQAKYASGGEVNPKLAQVPPSDRMSMKLYPQHLMDTAHIYHSDAMMACGGMALQGGGSVPGKAKVPGDSLQNDVVPAKLSPGEVVIPRSVMQSDNPGEAAKSFVEQLHGKYAEKGNEEDDFKSALKKAISTRKSK